MMNVNVLIDAIVRQTMVLVAQLATMQGTRTPLAHLLNQVFMNLSMELQAQGLGRKVIADMFGMTLRAYHAKMRRLSESRTDSGQSLWEAVIAYLETRQNCTRAEVLHRFRRDEPAMVSGVLNDLVNSGVIFRSGDGASTCFRVVAAEDLALRTSVDRNANAIMVWVVCYRHGPLSRLQIAEHLPALSQEALAEAMVLLEQESKLRRRLIDTREEFVAEECMIPVGAEHGWEAAVLDHFQAMATAIAAKIRQGDRKSQFDDCIGGSTYHFEVNAQHPLKDEVFALFRDVRERATDLRERVSQHNEAQSDLEPSHSTMRFNFYVGQMLIEDAGEENED